MRPVEGLRVGFAVMAKAPIAGEAKTRLGATIGHAAAARIYAGFLADTLEVVDRIARQRDVAARLVVCPDARHQQRLGEIVGTGWDVRAQQRRGLMGGIVDAFQAGFEKGARAVVVTDADSPLALVEHLEACLTALIDHDLVLGPTADGGYYLIAAIAGVRRRLPGLLLGETFDSATICAATVRRARSLGLILGLGPPGLDVDTRDDLDILAVQLARAPADTLRHCRALVESWEPRRDPRLVVPPLGKHPIPVSSWLADVTVGDA